MPWRLILFLIVLALVVAFAGFNTQNVATISFGFYSLDSVPVFLGLFAAFFLGVLVMLPFTLGRRRRGKAKGSGSTQKGVKKGSNGGAEQPKLTGERDGSVDAAREASRPPRVAGKAHKVRRKKGARRAAKEAAPGDLPPSSPS
ncbi:MAG: lipopolysaccharide assembly LapA domain-containing protein [Spirochaetaceae bacterium]